MLSLFVCLSFSLRLSLSVILPVSFSVSIYFTRSLSLSHFVPANLPISSLCLKDIGWQVRTEMADYSTSTDSTQRYTPVIHFLLPQFNASFLYMLYNSLPLSSPPTYFTTSAIRSFITPFLYRHFLPSSSPIFRCLFLTFLKFFFLSLLHFLLILSLFLVLFPPLPCTSISFCFPIWRCGGVALSYTRGDRWPYSRLASNRTPLRQQHQDNVNSVSSFHTISSPLSLTPSSHFPYWHCQVAHTHTHTQIRASILHQNFTHGGTHLQLMNIEMKGEHASKVIVCNMFERIKQKDGFHSVSRLAKLGSSRASHNMRTLTTTIQWFIGAAHRHKSLRAKIN